jgi:ammonium transporter, Amt family
MSGPVAAESGEATQAGAPQGCGPAGADGLLAGDPSLLWKQAVGLLAAGAYALVVTLGILFVLDRTMGLRVPEDEEREGLDATQHGEAAYTS